MTATSEDRHAWVARLNERAVSRFGSDHVIGRLELADDAFVDGCIACGVSPDEVLDDAVGAVSEALAARLETNATSPRF